MKWIVEIGMPSRHHSNLIRLQIPECAGRSKLADVVGEEMEAGEVGPFSLAPFAHDSLAPCYRVAAEPTWRRKSCNPSPLG